MLRALSANKNQFCCPLFNNSASSQHYARDRLYMRLQCITQRLWPLTITLLISSMIPKKESFLCILINCPMSPFPSIFLLSRVPRAAPSSGPRALGMNNRQDKEEKNTLYFWQGVPLLILPVSQARWKCLRDTR